MRRKGGSVFKVKVGEGRLHLRSHWLVWFCYRSTAADLPNDFGDSPRSDLWLASSKVMRVQPSSPRRRRRERWWWW